MLMTTSGRLLVDGVTNTTPLWGDCGGAWSYVPLKSESVMRDEVGTPT